MAATPSRARSKPPRSAPAPGRGATVVPGPGSLQALHGAPTRRTTTAEDGLAGTTHAHFGDLREPLLEFIAGSPVLVGCIAWVTERTLLEALATRPVALVVQKENWWKKTDARGQALARRYAALQGGLAAWQFPDPLGTRAVRGKPVRREEALAPIACAGWSGATQHQPLMHHKFLIRCEVAGDGTLSPVAVWTGSFNFSANASSSFENAVEIHDPKIAAAYLAEFALVAMVSEPMAWRYARPMPKGPCDVPFAPAPVPPPKTTTRVVKGAGRKRAAAARKRPATAVPAAKKAAPAKNAGRKAARSTAASARRRAS